jgi:hypothetical protein
MTAPPVQAPQRHADADAHERHQRAAQGDNRRSQPSCPKYLTAASMNNRTRTNITDAGPRDPAARPDFGQLPGIAESRRLVAGGPPSPNRHPSLPKEIAGGHSPPARTGRRLSTLVHRPQPAPRAGGSQAHQKQPHRTPGHLEDEEAGPFTQTRQGPNVRLLRSAGCSLSVTADVRVEGSLADVPDNRPLSGGSVGRSLSEKQTTASAWAAGALAGGRRCRPRPQ